MKDDTPVRSLSAVESSSETNVLASKRREAQIEPVVFDATIRGILSRQETQAGDFAFRAEVNHQRVRMARVRRAPERVPESFRVAVKRSFRLIALREIFLAVHVYHFPAFARNCFASGVQHVQFGKRGELVAVMRRQRLQAEIPRLLSGESRSE